MVNIYDKANELEKALREDETFKAVEAAFEKLEENPTSKELYKEFVVKQQEFMQLYQTGQEPGEEAMAGFQELQQKLIADEVVAGLIQAQQRLQLTLEDINKAIYKPLDELFSKYEK